MKPGLRVAVDVCESTSQRNYPQLPTPNHGESGKIEDSMYVFHLSTKQQKHSVLIYCQCKPLRTCPNTRVTEPKVMLIPDPRANPNSKFKKTAKDIPPFSDVVP